MISSVQEIHQAIVLCTPLNTPFLYTVMVTTTIFRIASPYEQKRGYVRPHKGLYAVVK